MREGFDDRLGWCNSYGRGVYVTTELCNIKQYSEEGCIILARVVLGHPFVDTAAMLDEPRPPAVPGHDALHDSIVVQPGIDHGKGIGRSNRQDLRTHWT